MSREAAFISVATFEAKCHECGNVFPHPSLGDFAYGETIFTSTDGQASTFASAFEEFPQRVSSRITEASEFWRVLSVLADPVQGKHFRPELRCPRCASCRLEYWQGDRIGEVKLPKATFTSASELTDEALTENIEQIRCDPK